jgi:hypothetical protein
MQWSMTAVALAMAMIVLAGILVYAIRYKINNSDVHKERLLYFRSKAFAVSTLTVGCFFTDELPKSLFIDKMKTRPVIALAALKLKAKVLGLKVIILGFPGLLVGLLMDGDEVTDYSDRPLQPQVMKTVTVETFGVDYPEPEKH